MRLPTSPALVGLGAILVSALAAAGPAGAQIGPVPGDEGAIQAYLALWSRNADVGPAAVERFYAPTVVYYGKSLSRAQVLADKLRYIKAWPERAYREIPGTIDAHCNGNRSRCRVSVMMTWRRISRGGKSSAGRARIAFDFVPVDGTPKIAR